MEIHKYYEKLNAVPGTNEVVLMMGIPYAGKTREAQRLKKKFGWPIVSPDAIRLGLHGGRFNPVMEPWVWIIARLMVKVLHLTGHRVVIVDACNGTRKRREEWLSNDYLLTVRFVPEVVDVCIERARSWGDEEIVRTIERMAAAFEPLNPDEEGIEAFNEEHYEEVYR